MLITSLLTGPESARAVNSFKFINEKLITVRINANGITPGALYDPAAEYANDGDGLVLLSNTIGLDADEITLGGLSDTVVKSTTSIFYQPLLTLV